MKLLFDLFPVILFFVAFKYAENLPDDAAILLSNLPLMGAVTATQAPILLATLVVIVATLLQVIWVLFRHGKVDKMLWISLLLVVVFGGLTLVFHNEAFIKWKPTLLYWIFSFSLFLGGVLLKKNPIKSMMGAEFQLPEPVWRRLNWAWVIFFLAMGFLNLVIAFSFPLSVWVNFKLFGGMGLMFLFVLGQALFLAKYQVEEKD